MPQTLWEQIHIGFVIEILEDDRYGTIVTCIDCFNKMVVLVPLYELDELTVANHFLVEVVSHHGLPVTIICNRDPRF